jgi:diacylglycerol kinase
LVISAELINTAIESSVDLTTKETQSLAKIAKDCAAGAVLVLAISSVVVWGVIVYGKI